MKENITAFEGTLHKLTVNVSGVEDFSDYLVYGAAQPYGCSKCAHFEVVTKTEGTCEMIIPALSCGIYKYQLFIKRISTNQEFLILEGEINVKDRLCDCSAVTSNDETATVVDATFSADTVEVNVSIQEGAEGKPGPQGPAGGVNEEEMQEILEPYATKEYVDEKIATSGPSESLTTDDKKRLVEELYGINLSLASEWVIYNDFGGVSAYSDGITVTDTSYAELDEFDAQGNIWNNIFATPSFIKNVKNFTISPSEGVYSPMSNWINLESFQQQGEEINTINIKDRTRNTWDTTSWLGNLRNIKEIKFLANDNFTDARGLFQNSGFEKITGEMPGVTVGDQMFAGTKISKLEISLPNLQSASGIFQDCKNLTDIEQVFPAVTSAGNAFENSGFSAFNKLTEIFPNSTSFYATLRGCHSAQETCDFDFPSVTNLYEFLAETKGVKEVTINAPLATEAQGILSRSEVEKATLVFDSLNRDWYASSSYLLGYGNKHIKEVDCTLPSLASGRYFFSDLPTLEKIKLNLPVAYGMQDMLRNTENLKDMDITAPVYNSYYSTFKPNFNYVLENVKLDTPNMIGGMNTIFKDNTNLKTFTATSLSKITTMNQTFKGCTSLETFQCDDLSGVTNLESAFEGCTSLKELELNTSSDTLERVNAMCKGCTSLERVKINAYGESLLTTVSQDEIFDGCIKLSVIDGSSIIPTNLGSASIWYGFRDCNLDYNTVGRQILGVGWPGSKAAKIYMGIKRSALRFFEERGFANLDKVNTETYTNVGDGNTSKSYVYLIRITSED